MTSHGFSLPPWKANFLLSVRGRSLPTPYSIDTYKCIRYWPDTLGRLLLTSFFFPNSIVRWHNTYHQTNTCIASDIYIYLCINAFIQVFVISTFTLFVFEYGTFLRKRNKNNNNIQNFNNPYRFWQCRNSIRRKEQRHGQMDKNHVVTMKNIDTVAWKIFHNIVSYIAL